jgi:hypothetical protein
MRTMHGAQWEWVQSCPAFCCLLLLGFDVGIVWIRLNDSVMMGLVWLLVSWAIFSLPSVSVSRMKWTQEGRERNLSTGVLRDR